MNQILARQSYLGSVLSHFVKKMPHFVIKKMSHLVITLVVLSIANWKCGSMLGGQVNPIISIIIDNNSNNNYSTELFSAPISQVGA